MHWSLQFIIKFYSVFEHNFFILRFYCFTLLLNLTLTSLSFSTLNKGSQSVPCVINSEPIKPQRWMFVWMWHYIRSLEQYQKSNQSCMFFSCLVAFQSESTLYSCLNVKELLAWSRREKWGLSDWNWTGIQNHLFLKRTLNRLAKVAWWFSCVLRTYLHSAFDCMFLSWHVPVSEWIHNVYLSQCQGTPCSKQAMKSEG